MKESTWESSNLFEIHNTRGKEDLTTIMKIAMAKFLTAK